MMNKFYAIKWFSSSKRIFNQVISNFEIFDISGKKVKNYHQASSQFDVSNLQSGLYIIKGLDSTGLLFTQKLIKE